MFCECGTWCDRMPSITKTKMIITKNDEKGLCCSWFSAFSWFTSHTPTCLYRIYRLCDSLERRGIYTASCGPLHCLSLSCNLWSLLPVQGWFCALLSFPFMLKASSTRTQRRKSGGKRITASSSFFSPHDVGLHLSGKFICCGKNSLYISANIFDFMTSTSILKQHLLLLFFSGHFKNILINFFYY